ncbi:hypothetical protein EVAR_2304_1 [Eumeta japonica]|uniref:Uncharacterized protein n=1 Tax=Eumeta variegata TaxID=151549 RepID=A0A4C1SIR9_EUMVA|nr:hypothetical protein EVAR_2304_1 [Eumeta japonica]
MLKSHGVSHACTFRSYAHSIDVSVVHGGGRATVTEFVTEIDWTALEFCKHDTKYLKGCHNVKTIDRLAGDKPGAVARRRVTSRPRAPPRPAAGFKGTTPGLIALKLSWG